MRSTLAVCLGLWGSFLAAQTDPALTAFVTDPALAGARIGVIVRDLASGETLLANDADKGFMTASNMKLVSSAVALETLGPDFRFVTRLVGTRAVHDGVLDGDLVLIGCGDPTFGGRQEGDDPSKVFDRFVDTLVSEHGLRRITGRVIGDDDCQPDEIMGEGWSWGYETDAYAAQVSGLCFGENTVQVELTSGTALDAAAGARFVPLTTYLSITSSAVTGPADSRASMWASRQRGGNRVTVGGRIPLGAKPSRERITVDNPTAFAAHVLRETLLRRGIEVEGPAVDRDELSDRLERYGDEVELATHESAPLAEILVTLNKVSQNLYAEQMIRAASRIASGKGGMDAASAHAKTVLASLGADVAGMRIADGSGLSRLNLVQPHQLASLLEGMWRSPHRDVFLPTLPIAGVDGTLRRRFADSPAKGVVRAKTGYISAVAGLSGYVIRPDDRPPLVFSILLNNFTCPTRAAQQAIDGFVGSLVGR